MRATTFIHKDEIRALIADAMMQTMDIRVTSLAVFFNDNENSARVGLRTPRFLNAQTIEQIIARAMAGRGYMVLQVNFKTPPDDTGGAQAEIILDLPYCLPLH
jgi:hypothetical protein